MHVPTVSVLMTAFNRENYIAEAIESVLSSTYADFELIIVDDGSVDRTVEIARNYARLDERVHVFVNEKNLGDYPNRNYAASLANGRYLKYLDADDMMYPHCLEFMVYQMDLFPDAALGFTKDLGIGLLYPMVLSPRDALRIEFIGQGALTNGPTFAIFRTDVFRKLGGFQCDRMTSDVAFSLKSILSYPVVFTMPNLVYYRYHPGQESVWGNQQNDVLARYFRIRRNTIKGARNILGDADWRTSTGNLIGIHLRIIARYFMKGRWKSAVEIWRLSELGLRDLRWLLIPSRHASLSVIGIELQTISPNWKCFPGATAVS